MGLFGPKLPVDLDEFEWLIACFAWLERDLETRKATADWRPLLVLPELDVIRKAKTASDLFLAVKELSGLAEWPCELERGHVRNEVYPSGIGHSHSSKHALGTFSVEGNKAVIRYDPALLGQPQALLATFAHELAHLWLHSVGDPPGGPDLHEHATDCAAVYLGFGVFLANSARNFEQFQDLGMHGWKAQASGYLSERALVTALAIFVRRFGYQAKTAGAPLKPYLRSDFMDALKYIDRRLPDIAQTISSVDLSDWQ